MGSPKGLLRLADRFWIEDQVEHLRTVGVEDIVIILGYGADSYYEALPLLREGLISGMEVRVIENTQPELGQFSSILKGLSKTALDHSVFILPIDVPCAAEAAWVTLFERLHRNNDVNVCIPTFSERGGHPVLLSHYFCNSLLSRSPQSRLDLEIQNLPEKKVARLEIVDPRVTFNLNTIEDWEKFKVLSSLA